MAGLGDAFSLREASESSGAHFSTRTASALPSVSAVTLPSSAFQSTILPSAHEPDGRAPATPNRAVRGR